jgi:hypothetical protein
LLITAHSYKAKNNDGSKEEVVEIIEKALERYFRKRGCLLYEYDF